MTRVYGRSDDLIEFDGDLSEEHGGDESLLSFSDGTILLVKYGKPHYGGVWSVTAVRRGLLLNRIDVCEDDEADPYSDVAHFDDGLKWVYASNQFVKIK